jgi:ribokinase
MPKHSARSQGRVIVVGSTNTDLVVHCATLPYPGETVLGGDLLTFAGGKGANQAVAAARAGAEVRFIGAFGDDAFGRARRADLEKEGVDCSGCVVKKGVASGVALIAIGENKGKAKAENLIVVAPGANIRLTPADLRRALPTLTGGDVVLVCLEIPFATVLAALRAGKSAGATTILNPAPSPGHSLPQAFLRAASVITPNESEARALLGTEPRTPAARRKLLKLTDEGCAHIIITRGARGVDYYFSHSASPRGPWELASETIPAPNVKPVDTVGAGDCFNGCLAAYLAAHQFEFEDAIRFAVAAAALKVTRHGAQAGMPHRAEILRMMS